MEKEVDYKKWFEMKSKAAAKALADLSTANLKILALEEEIKSLEDYISDLRSNQCNCSNGWY